MEKLRLSAGAWEYPFPLCDGGISMKLTVTEFAPVEADPVPLVVVEVLPVVEPVVEVCELLMVMVPEQSAFTV